MYERYEIKPHQNIVVDRANARESDEWHVSHDREYCVTLEEEVNTACPTTSSCSPNLLDEVGELGELVDEVENQNVHEKARPLSNHNKVALSTSGDFLY